MLNHNPAHPLSYATTLDIEQVNLKPQPILIVYCPSSYFETLWIVPFPDRGARYYCVGTVDRTYCRYSSTYCL